MNFRIEVTETFDKELKRLQRKYPSLKEEVKALGITLALNPVEGDALGNDVYKIRIAIASKGKGKRGGRRIITCVKVVKKVVYLLSIYSKGEKNDISRDELQLLMKEIPS